MATDPALAARVASAAFDAAFTFFKPSPEWTIDLEQCKIDEEEVPGQLWTKPRYLMGKIVYDPAQCEGGAEVWRVIGHEVAHLLSSEFNVLEGQLPRQFQGFSEHATELLTTRLERLFCRERPYPGDEAFKEPTP